MQSVLLSLSLLASAAIGVLAVDDLKIDVTLPVECERTSKKGDRIDVHYRGTLQSNGEKFDASSSARNLPAHAISWFSNTLDDALTMTLRTGYDRGQPFSFSLGGGQVIKGYGC